MSNSLRNRYKLFAAALLTLVLAMTSGDAFAQRAFIDKLVGKLRKETDSTEVAKPRLPLESYFFDDSLRNKQIFSWNAKLDMNQVDTIIVDTVLNRFEIDYPFMRQDVGAAYLGNLGAAAIPLNYFNRTEMRNFTFLRGYDSYLITPERARFFNVKRPFTNLSWYMSGQTRNAEEQLRVLHAQNISPSTGFNIDYYNRGTKGMYSSQRSKDKNLSVAFAHTGKKYSIHAGYIYNMGEIRENGGIQRDEDVIDTIYDLPYNIEVNMTDAKNLFKGNTFYASQTYGIPLQRVTDEDFSIADKSSLFVGHAIEYTTFFKKYTDTKANVADGYYEHWYIHPNRTVDSLHESKLDNKLFLQIQPWDRNAVIGTIDAGVGFAMHKYHYFSPDNYLSGNTSAKKNDTYLYGALTGKLRQYIDWRAHLTYHPVGFRSQDLNLNANLKMTIFIKERPLSLTVSGFIDRRTPSYWDENYFSNHFAWNNSFDKEMETRVEAKLEAEAIGFEAGFWQSITTDKIYYGTDKLPVQNSGTLSVTGAYVMKNFKAGIFHFNHRVLLQWSSDEDVVALPLASAYAAYFADFHLVRNILQMQIGIDAWYNTEYYAPAYNPATMQFHNQREKKLGNYLFMDAFVAAKWKRMRILAKFQHVNEDLFGRRNYFSVLHYPLNRRMFKLGFSWSFYD